MTLDTTQKVARKEPPMSTEMGTKTTLTGASFGGGLIFAWATLRGGQIYAWVTFTGAGLIFACVTFAWRANFAWGGAELMFAW